MEIPGHITIIQEGRIRVFGDDGRAYLLTLSRRMDAEDIKGLQERNAHVLVRYRGEPDLESGVVEEIEEIPAIIPQIELDSVILSEGSAL